LEPKKPCQKWRGFLLLEQPDYQALMPLGQPMIFPRKDGQG
jgi:hypothetical protein